MVRLTLKINLKIFIVILVLLITGFISVLVYEYLKPEYVAVYFRTGELYFGKLYKFPRTRLKNVYFLYGTGGPDLGIAYFNSSSWAPKGDVWLNKYNVIWIAPLKENSQIYNLIKQNIPIQPQKISPAVNMPLPQKEAGFQSGNLPRIPE